MYRIENLLTDYFLGLCVCVYGGWCVVMPWHQIPPILLVSNCLFESIFFKLIKILRKFFIFSVSPRILCNSMIKKRGRRKEKTRIVLFCLQCLRRDQSLRSSTTRKDGQKTRWNNYRINITARRMTRLCVREFVRWIKIIRARNRLCFPHYYSENPPNSQFHQD